MTTRRGGDEAREAAELRARAETRLAAESAAAEAPPTADETRRLVHELRVHQHELELQNQELRETRARLEASLQGFTDLFDFAPIGYCVLDSAGVIRRVNLAGAALLGLPRAELIGQPFPPFLEPGTRPAFVDFLARVLIDDARQTCRVTLHPVGAPADAPPRELWLEARAAEADGDHQSLIALMDITEQERLAAERTAVLREYADLYRAIVESPVIVRLLIDPGCGRILEANQAATRYYGRSQEDLRRLCIQDLRADPVRDQTLELLASGEHPDPDLSARHRLASGEVRDVTIYPEVLRSAGRILVLATVIDVTERRRQEAALLAEREEATRHASEQRLGALVEQGLVGVSETDLEGRLTRVNDRYCELLGRPREALLGTQVREFVAPEDWPRIRASLDRLLAGGPPEVYDKRYRCPDGRLIHAQTAAVAVRDGAGRMTGLLGLTTDITAQRAAEERLREGERRLVRALEGAGHGVWDWTIATDTLVFSAASQAMYGYTAEPLPTEVSEWEKLVHPEDFARAREAILAHLDGATPTYECVIRVRCKDGRWLWVLDRGSVLERDAAGRPLRMLGTHTDITAQKEAEEELRKTRNNLAEAQRISHLGSFEHDVVTDRLVWSDEIHRIYGLDPTGPTPSFEEMLARCIHPEDAALVEQGYTAAVRQCRVYELEHRIIRPDGRVRWVQALAHPYYDETGRLARYVGSVLDITERKRSEAELNRLHAILEAALAAMSDAVFVSDAQGRIVYTNDAFFTFHRFAPDEAWLRPLAEYPEVFGLCLADGTPASLEQWPMSRALRGETGIGVEYGLLRKDKGETWLGSYNFAPIRGPDGGIIGSVGTARDITEDKALRRALEHERATLEEQVQARTAELRALTERMELAAEAGGIGVWEWDTDRGTIVWDARLRRIYGLPAEGPDPDYETWCRWIEPEDLAAVEADARAVLGRKQNLLKATFLIHCPDGRARQLAVRGRLQDRAGATSQIMVGVNWDVTEERRAAAALAASEARARAVIESSPVPLAIAEETGPVHYLNTAFIRSFGYTLEDLPTWDDFRRLALPDPAGRERIRRLRREQVAQADRDGGPCTPLEFDICCKDGSTRTVVARVTPLDGGEYLNTLYDITDLKAARDAAERAAEAKSDFLAHMSHEIRTPLNAVLGLAQVLERTALDPDQRDLVAQVRLAGRSLLALINDILDLSKIESGRLSLDPQPFALATLLGDLEALLAPGARAKGLTFAIAPAPDLDGDLVADAMRLEQILVNLIGNAIKFTEHGGILVGVSMTECTPERVRLRFGVADTGIGISPEALARLFTPFTQADTGITRRFGGTGLGLSICKRLVELMGGEIGADSQPGAGSTFWFELPCEVAPASSRLEPAARRLDTGSSDRLQAGSTGPRLAGVRVLVVDDSVMNRMVIERLLAPEGVLTAPAGDGEQALARLRAAPQGFDAVLMDVQMPVMDGLTATRLIRAEPGLADLPVIALTAGVLPHQQEAARAAGMNDVLTKPLELTRLLACLLRWVKPRPATWGTDTDRPARPHQDRRPAPAAFPEIAGIDSVAAAATLAGDRGLFFDLLERLALESANLTAATRRALAAGDRETAARSMHSLKGNAGLVGALELAGLAARLEQAIERSAVLPDLDDLAQDLGALDQALDALIAASAPWCSAAAQRAAGADDDHALDPATIPQRLERLRLALRMQQLDAFDGFDALRPWLLSTLGEARCGALSHAVHGLDFAAALALLDPLDPPPGAADP